jgi:glycosyltransferase involved in cell wall biosynthesis
MYAVCLLFGYFVFAKKFDMNKPHLSVVTVVYNSLHFLENTILSVLGQTYKNIEYIIIDGGSTDGTLAIIEKYNKQLAYWVSEPDKGLYDAMNKGLQQAKGEYLLFLNSGDVFYDSQVIEKIFTGFPEADIYYGDTLNIDDEGNEKGIRRLRAPEKLDWKSFRNGMLVSHQSIIVRRSIAEAYNLHYRFSADVDWVIRALKKSKNNCNTGLIISKMTEAGTTRNNLLKSLKERFHIMARYYGWFPTLMRHFGFVFRFAWFYFRKGRY